ncbi:MAG: toxin-antitoxin system, antitoxin component, Xre family protein [Clostridia bacterium]|nr:toxin-antitoxin system, antitoxin component, Xre family protein [Clostridia bacterium]
MIDTKLNQYIKSRGLKSGFIASQLGITYQGFHKKMTKQTFTAQEALQLKRLLDISDKDMAEIFEK